MSTLLILSACDLERTRPQEPAAEEQPSWNDDGAEPDAATAVAPEATPAQLPSRNDASDWQGEVTAAMLDGQWVGGPPTAFEVLVDVEGTLVTATDLTGQREPESTLFELVEVDGAHATFRAAGAGEIVDVHALFLTSDEALLWLIGENEFGVLRRVGALPEALLGDWQAVQTSGQLAPQRVRLDNESLSVADNAPVAISPLSAGSGNTVDVVVVGAGRGGELLHFRRLDEQVYLSWAEDDDEFAVFYRAGERPQWLPEADPLPSDGGSDPTSPLTPQPTPTTQPSQAPGPTDGGLNAEPHHNLTVLAERAREYYLRNSHYPNATDWTPASDACPPGVHAGDVAWSHPTWEALSFRPADGHLFQYRFLHNRDRFEAQARIDRDCDGVYHQLLITGRGGSTPSFSGIVEDNAGE